MLKSDSFILSAVGRVQNPAGATSARPFAFPVITRISEPFKIKYTVHYKQKTPISKLFYKLTRFQVKFFERFGKLFFKKVSQGFAFSLCVDDKKEAGACRFPRLPSILLF
jgi:hypothetical protein